MNLSKLCRSDIEEICAFCQHSSLMLEPNYSICKKYGKVLNTHSCKKFKYNPLKRVPPKRAKLKTNYDLGDL